MSVSIKEKISWGILLLCAVFAVYFVFSLQKKAPPIEDLIEKGLQAYQAKDYETAAESFGRLISEGNSEAMFMLGALYMGGQGVERDRPKAMALYRQSAALGYAPAQTTLAVLYATDDSLFDREKALIYARQAAFQGDVEAQMMLASWFEQGFFGERNIPEMLYWYRQAAANGHNDAKLALALFYQHGRHGLPANPYTSKRWFDSIEEQKKFENRFSGKETPVIHTGKPQ